MLLLMFFLFVEGIQIQFEIQHECAELRELVMCCSYVFFQKYEYINFINDEYRTNHYRSIAYCLS